MRCLVSGASGVVGRYLVRELIENTPSVEQVVALSRRNRYRYEDHPERSNAMLLDCWGDLRLDCTRLVTQFKPDIVFHCAGEGRQNAPTKSIWQSNVDTTFNLLEACTKLDSKVNFVYCSSIMCDNKDVNFYTASKIAGEALVQSYDAMCKTIKGINVRFPAVAGAGNKHGVVKAVVEKLLDKNTNILSLYTNSIKPFVYAHELVSKIIEIANNDYPYGAQWYLCPEDNISVEQIANIAMYKTQIDKKIEWSNNSWPGDKQEVKHTSSHYNMMNSYTAVSAAIDDILREDYRFTI